MTNNKSTSEKIIRFLLSEPDLANGRTSIDPNESLIASGAIDSVAVLKLVGYIEEEFDIELDAEDVTMETFDAVSSITRLLEKRFGL